MGDRADCLCDLLHPLRHSLRRGGRDLLTDAGALKNRLTQKRMNFTAETAKNAEKT
jgi:hypothetical protein